MTSLIQHNNSGASYWLMRNKSRYAKLEKWNTVFETLVFLHSVECNTRSLQLWSAIPGAYSNGVQYQELTAMERNTTSLEPLGGWAAADLRKTKGLLHPDGDVIQTLGKEGMMVRAHDEECRWPYHWGLCKIGSNRVQVRFYLMREKFS